LTVYLGLVPLVVVGTVVEMLVLLFAVIVDVVVAVVVVLVTSRWSPFASGSCSSPPREEGDFFHDGRFATLSDVVDHYNSTFRLVLIDPEKPEKTDRIEYLKSLLSRTLWG
jgi:hypothetical protein